LIDAHALLYRSYFAIRNLNTSRGQATNAAFGFLNTLRKILRDYHPQYMAVCFDAGKKTLRQEKFKNYKIHRPSMPDDLISQIPLVKEIVQGYHLPVFELEGFEADDLIATLTREAQRHDLEVVIISDDKDMMQLVNEKVKIFSARKEAMLGTQDVRELFGVEAQRMPDFIGLAGDQTDNIPGVVGVGEVTAKTLLKEFKSLEEIFANIDRIQPLKIKEKLRQQKEMAFISKELAVLDEKVPIDFNLSSLKVGQPDERRLLELFQKLEFKKFAQELTAQMTRNISIALKEVVTKEECTELLAQIAEKGEFSFLLDWEDSLDNPSVRGIVLAASSKNSLAYYFPISYLTELKAIFEDHQIIKVTHDFKQVMKAFEAHRCSLKGKIFDVMLVGYLLDPSHRSYDPGSLAWNYLKIPVGGEGSQVLAQEVIVLLEMYPILLKELREKSLLKLFEHIEMPLAYVLFRMETSGVRLDQRLLSELSSETEKEIDALARQIQKIAGAECNLNSPKQLSQLLFEKLKLPVVKKTKTGFSTDEEVLTRLAENHEIARQLLEFRQLSKLKSTYIDALPRMINPRTGYLHASFNQTGTETGRLSSLSPNLQNIPIRTELGRRIRKAFIPWEKDHVILSADYSQIELRILAHLSQDKNLMKAFHDNQDIHTYTARLIFGVTGNPVSYAMRDTAKRINFGIIYGMSAFGLSKDLAISQDEAQEFIDKYFLRYPGVKVFIEDEIKKAQTQGFVVTLLNRRRYLPEIQSKNPALRQFAERQAINTPVQGSAADLMKLAMINIQKDMEERALVSRMIITVHDELVFDVPQREEEIMPDLVARHMENSLPLSVPIKVSIKIGKNWLDMREVYRNSSF